VRINNRLSETAKVVQQSESQMSLIQARLKELGGEEQRLVALVDHPSGPADKGVVNAQLTELRDVRDEMKSEGNKLWVEIARLAELRERLNTLGEQKRQSMEQIERIKIDAADISKIGSELSDIKKYAPKEPIAPAR
jgi:DNA repair ATPase RecN